MKEEEEWGEREKKVRHRRTKRRKTNLSFGALEAVSWAEGCECLQRCECPGSFCWLGPFHVGGRQGDRRQETSDCVLVPASPGLQLYSLKKQQHRKSTCPVGVSSNCLSHHFCVTHQNSQPSSSISKTEALKVLFHRVLVKIKW